MLLAFSQLGIFRYFSHPSSNVSIMQTRLKQKKLETVHAENFACEGNLSAIFLHNIVSLLEVQSAVYDHKTCQLIEQVIVAPILKACSLESRS